MILMAVGAASLLPKPGMALAATVVIWLVPNLARSAVQDVEMFNENMMLELIPLLGVAIFTSLARKNLDSLEAENMIAGATPEGDDLVDPSTGVYDERLLRPALEMEVARGRRFNRNFAFVLVGIDAMRQRFDYRDNAAWDESFVATARMLRGTRTNVDRVYRYGLSSFAMVLPESGTKDVHGLVRRLSRAARRSSPAEGEPGGPLPCHYGATFFPQAATTVDDLLRRAEVALRLAESNPTRVQLDGAEAPEMAAPETLRTHAEDMEVAVPTPAYEPGAEPAFAQQQPAYAETPQVAYEAPAVEPLPMHAEPVSPAPQPVAASYEPEPATHYREMEAATGVPAVVYIASAPEADHPPMPEPQPLVASVEPQSEPVAAVPQQTGSLDDRMVQLLKRMEETEELMRTLRKAG
jgi:diguanylate cyclase (GGDEF)-like protein